MITKKYYKLIRVSHADEGYFYIKNVSNEVGEFSFVKKGSPTTSNYDTEYSLDGVNWTSYDFTNLPTVSLNPNQNLYLRGTKFTPPTAALVNFTINFNKSYSVFGNLLSIKNYNTMTTETTIGTKTFNSLFYEQTNLISAENLNFGNVSSVGNSSFYYFFYGCSGLVKLPDFSNIITSTDTSSFREAFENCSSLVQGADFSNVTTVGNGFLYGAYKGCTHISNVTTPNIQDLNTTYLTEWLQNAGTQATGTKTVNVPTGATITTGSNSGIPTGWTRVDY